MAQNFNVGAAVAYARHRHGKSARKASLDAGLSESWAGKVETGEIAPSLRAFAHVAVALGFTDAEIALVVRTEATLPLRETRPVVDDADSVSHPLGRVVP